MVCEAVSARCEAGARTRCRVGNQWKPWTFCAVSMVFNDIICSTYHIKPYKTMGNYWTQQTPAIQFRKTRMSSSTILHEQLAKRPPKLAAPVRISGWKKPNLWMVKSYCQVRWGKWRRVVLVTKIKHGTINGHFQENCWDFSVAMFDFQRDQKGGLVSEFRFWVTLCDDFQPKRTQPPASVKQK